MIRVRPMLLLALASAVPLAARAAGKSAWEIDREFRRIERRLFGPDEQIRDACGAALGAIEDRPLVLERSVEMRRSDVRLRGANAADLRACARAVAGAGVVESWRVTPADDGAFALDVVLLRARRDPHVIGRRRSEKTDKEAAKALAAIWADRNEPFEALGPEVVAPDLLDLYEARWFAGNFVFEGRAPDDRFADGYGRLVRAVVPSGALIEWAVAADAPPAEVPALPDAGRLRAAFREAPSGALLRLFAEMDRRDFVVPSGEGTRSGTLGGGWAGIANAMAESMGRTVLRAGQVDVFAPASAEPMERRAWDGRRVTLDLEAVPASALWTLLSVAGKAAVEGPADLPPTDIHVKNVPWDQVVDAIALAHGCTTTAKEANDRRVVCPEGVARAKVAPEAAGGQADAPAKVDERPPLTRQPASKLEVIAYGVRDSGKYWRALVRTPDGLHVLVRTGSPIGVDGGLAVVDEHGVSVVLERLRHDGVVVRTAVPLAF